MQAYEDLAVQLASDKKSLKALRQKLADAKENSPLFDSERFTRNLEQQYRELVAGLPEAPAQAEVVQLPSRPQSQPMQALAPAAPLTSPPPKKINKITATVQEAEEHQSRGDMNAAINTYRRWLKQSHHNSPNDWIAQFNLGILLRNIGNLKEAKDALRSALRQKPDFDLARTALNQMENS